MKSSTPTTDREEIASLVSVVVHKATYGRVQIGHDLAFHIADQILALGFTRSVASAAPIDEKKLS